MAAFEWRIGALYKTDANVAGAVCAALEKSAEGLTPASLLEASRSEEAPLHCEFEWNDGVAAEKYRLNQARRIIQNLVCTTVHEQQEIVERSFVSVRPNTVSAYVGLQRALSNEEWEAHLLESARRDLRAFTAKYGRLKQLANVTDEIKVFLAG